MNTENKEVQSTKDYVEELIKNAHDAEQRNTEEALKYSLEALSLAIEHDLPRQIARSYVRIGRCHWINGNFDEAIDHLGEALKLSDEIQETYAKVDALIGLGNVYITIETLDQAVTYYNNALNIAEEYGYGDLVAKILNNMGTLHEELKNYSVALDYYQKSLNKTIEIADIYGQAIANLNMGNVYMSLGNIVEAMKYITKAIEHGKSDEKTLLLAHAYHSMGLLYQKKKEYNESVNYLLLGVKKALESKDLYILFRIDIELGNTYDLMNQFDEAKQYYQKAFMRSQEIGMDELMPRIYEHMALFYEKHHMEEETLKYYKAYYKASKDVEENRRRERINSIDYQSRLSDSLEETKIYRELSNELRKSYESMHVLSTIGQAMTSTHKLDDIFEQLYDNVNLLMNAEGLYVGLFDEKENALRFDWYIEKGKKLDSFTLSLDNQKSWMVWSYLNKQAIKINDIEKEYKKYIKGLAATRGELMHSAMYAPLMVEGEVIGVFSIQAKEKNVYNDVHKDLLQTLASYLAIAIKNATKTKQLAKLNEMLKEKSEHDGLTGIPNRRLFDEIYEKLWTQSLNNEEELSVMIIDIDNFKDFNDQYGHLIGDEVVKSVAELLSKQKRDHHDFVARYGGDEFIAILPNSTKEDAEIFANKLRESLLVVNENLDIDTKVTISIGIASMVPSVDESKQKLIYTADNQLYLSKANGKDRSSSIRFEHLNKS